MVLVKVVKNYYVVVTPGECKVVSILGAAREVVGEIIESYMDQPLEMKIIIAGMTIGLLAAGVRMIIG